MRACQQYACYMLEGYSGCKMIKAAYAISITVSIII